MKITRHLAIFIFTVFLQLLILESIYAKNVPYYRIHSASYQNSEKAAADVKFLSGKGYEAASEKVDIPGKGIWYRVYVGPYDDGKKAEETALDLKKKKLVDEYRILKMAGPPVIVPPAAKPDRVVMAAPPPASEPFPPPLEKAKEAFETEQYEKTLEILKAFLDQGNSDPPAKEKALRLQADAEYFLGMKGSLQFLLQAEEHYKMLLGLYPHRAGDAALYYHMALGYEKLNFTYEAAGAWEKLMAVYPDSEFSQEAMFRLADNLFRTEKYQRAVEVLAAYLKKFPRGRYEKASFFALGYYYFRMGKYATASRQFDEARKKWPDLHNLSPFTLMRLGDAYFAAKNFDKALEMYSRYANLYAPEASASGALYKMALAAEKAEKPLMAVKLYSLYGEKYPQGKEKDESSVALARLGVHNRGLKLPYQVVDLDDYLHPLRAYDRILAKNGGGDREARVMLLKGEALEKAGQIRDAFATYLKMMKKHPQGPYHQENQKRLMKQAAFLLDEYDNRNDYLSLAEMHYSLQGSEALTGNFILAFKLAEGLRRTGLTGEAEKLYMLLKGKAKGAEERSLLTLAQAKIDMAGSQYGEAEKKLQSLLAGDEVKSSGLRREIRTNLADIFYREGLFDKAVSIYADVFALDKEGDRRNASYRRYGRSLLAEKRWPEAASLYRRALEDFERHPGKYEADLVAELYLGLGDAYSGQGKGREGIAMYDKALSHVSDQDLKRWLLLKTGRNYADLADFSNAERNLARVKENALEEFWPRVADYFLVESASREASNNNK